MSDDGLPTDRIRPTLRGWLRHLALVLGVWTALFAPIWILPARGWFVEGQPESTIFWELAALVAWYTLLALFVAAVLLRSAWNIRRHRQWPYPGAFVAFPMRIHRGWRAHFEVVGRTAFGLLLLAGVAWGWQAMQLPALLFGWGEYEREPVVCPDVEAVAPPAPAPTA